MLSRWYSLLLLVALGWLWFGGGRDYDSGTRSVITGLLISGMCPLMWVHTLRVMGWRSLRAVPLLVKVFFLSKRGATLMGLIATALLFWWSPLWKSPPPFRAAMSVSLVSTVVLMWLQPPHVLFLAESNRQSGSALERISTVIRPMRAIAMLDGSRTGIVLGGFSFFTDNLRTESDHEWRPLVDQLSNVAPRIVLDARADSPSVVFEVGLILSQPNRVKRTHFVVEDDGSAPALSHYQEELRGRTIHTVRERKLDSLFKGARYL